jgi:hypothetical protein
MAARFSHPVVLGSEIGEQYIMDSERFAKAGGIRIATECRLCPIT